MSEEQTETPLVVEEINVDAEAKKGPSLDKRISNKIENAILIGMGAFAITRDEIEATFEKLAERGEVVRQDKRAKMEEMRLKWEEMRAEQREKMKVKSTVVNSTATVAPDPDAPTKADIESLSKTIAELAKKVEELSSATGTA